MDNKYAWGLQTNFQTQKALAAGALRQLIVTDENAIDYEPQVQDNEDWSTGWASATEQWIESHESKVAHSMPGFSQELGRVFYLNLTNYAVTTPAGGTISKKHSFKPTDPTVTRQDPAVTYVERLHAGWHVLMPRSVSDGFSLKGSALGVLLCDFNLLGAGLLVKNPAVTYPPIATPTVAAATGLHKLFNTQVSLTPNDGASYNTPYACRYRGFSLDFKKTMLSQAGYMPGCAEYFVTNNKTSGVIRSAHEFDKQILDFSFEVDLAANTPEYDAVIDQRPISLVVDVQGGIIEAAIRHQLTVTINISRYKTSKPVKVDGMWRFTITGKAFLDTATGNLFTIDLTNNIATYASGW